MEEYTAIFGTLCQRLVTPAGQLSIHTSDGVMTADVVDAPLAAFSSTDVWVELLADPPG